MPAAAVTPAPIAYIKVVAVKKLVVGSWRSCECLVRLNGEYWRSVSIVGGNIQAVLECAVCLGSGAIRATEGWSACALGRVNARLGSCVLQSMFRLFYFEKIRVFKAGRVWPLNTLAWDNRTGR